MKYYCNPINIEYKYSYHKQNQCGDGFRMFREAADPSVILFQDCYYMFASMSGGVYVSDDLISWKYYPLNERLPKYDYAPDVRVIGEYVYFCASKSVKASMYFRTKNILNGPYEEIPGTFPFWDPSLFCDDDGRIYFYWGCSNQTPVYGIELMPNTLFPIGEKKPIILANEGEIGFERFGEDHTSASAPYIEGAWMTKYRGRYYLQFASTGTEFNIYNDGVYISDKPLGPFCLADNNPFSYHPGGFITGAGHGSTICDKNGNWWHAATMRISCNHNFERRLGIWKAGFDGDGELYCNQKYGDWPVAVAESSLEEEPEDTPWYLLSYKKETTASSFAEGYAPEYAVDENVRTWWKAENSNSGEWLQIDLGSVMEIHAIQLNFADDGVTARLPEGKNLDGDEKYIARYIETSGEPIRWLLEASVNQKQWYVVENKADTETSLAHDFLIREAGIEARYLRLTIYQQPFDQRACVSGFRVWGYGGGLKPEEPWFSAVRKSDLDMDVTMWAERAVGYNILWGSAPDKLYHSYLSYGNSQMIGALVKKQEYYVRVDAFNESGITHGKVAKIG